MTMTMTKAEGRQKIDYRTRRLGHANLFVTNIERTRRFILDVCGFEQTAIMPVTRAAFFSNGNTHHDIGIVEAKGHAQVRKKFPDPNEPEGRGSVPGLNHFGWELENEYDLVQAHNRAAAAGLRPRVTNNGTSYSDYLFAKDGSCHQFYADNDLDWRREFHGGEAEALHRDVKWVPGEKPPSKQPFYHPKPELRRVAAAPLHPMRVTHGVMVSNTFADSLAFYTDVAGFRVVHRGPGDAYVYLAGSADPYSIVLLPATDGRANGMHHVGFEVWPGEDLGRAAVELGRRGVTILADLDLAHKRSLCIADPDGIRYEFFVRRGGGFAALADLAGEAQAFAA
jgi:catechol 2,3-dioxygenase